MLTIAIPMDQVWLAAPTKYFLDLPMATAGVNIKVQ